MTLLLASLSFAFKARVIVAIAMHKIELDLKFKKEEISL